MSITTDSATETNRVYGDIVQDQVCLGKRLGNHSTQSEAACTNMTLIAASYVEEGLVLRQRFDGVLGLAAPTESRHKSFLNLLDLGALPHHFGFYVSDSGKNAELLFGGFDTRRLESEITWVPILPDSRGYWMIKLQGVRVGGRKLAACASGKGCYGLLQIGTPTISMHERTLPAVQEEIAKGTSAGDSCQLPDLGFDLEANAVLTLQVEDYVGAHCTPELRSHSWSEKMFGAEMVLLGEPLFRRYYTVFDWERRMMGFGRAKVERHCGRLGRAGLPMEDCVETEEVILFQTEIERHEL